MITKNQSEKVVKLSKHNQFVSRFLLPERIKKRVYGALDIRLFFCIYSVQTELNFKNMFMSKTMH